MTFRSDHEASVSVLLPIYHGDRGDWVEESLLSVRNQSRSANQIVIVLDGPVKDDVAAVVKRFADAVPVDLVRLNRNVGLGNALNAGLRHCQTKYVARMDADDICDHKRLERQLTFLEDNPDIDLLGTWILEFDPCQMDRCRYRKVPERHQEILKMARWRNPFNHMTVVFRKTVVEKVGGYRDVPGFEDYDLWVRTLSRGARCWNLQEPLVWARSDEALLNRRGGLLYLKREYSFLRELYRTGFISRFNFIVGLAARAAMRFAPAKSRRWLYRTIRTQDLSRVRRPNT